MELIDLGSIVNILLRTLGIFFFAFILLRLLGKKHLSHLTYLDLLLVIAMGSGVGDVMIYGESDVQMVTSLIALGTVALIVKALDVLSLNFKGFNHLISGQVRMVVSSGRVIPDALRKEQMSKDELLTLLREKGYDSFSETHKVFIESNGEISVVTK